ncbi:MAG: GNAT family N-acetyltransferase [Bacteroidota bacterium]
MIQYGIATSDDDNPTSFSRDDIADFLNTHLDEYGDERDAILKCIGYAYGDGEGQDGQILIAWDDEKDIIVGAVIINDTNMGGYIPEHILVYIAVHGEYRGQGLGKGLMERIIEATEGDIALHVEPENPAKFLYEKYGFTNKYLEMRLHK